VTASGPNDTVKVCPGTYTERVQIIGSAHDGLRLESLTPLARRSNGHQTFRRIISSLTSTGPTV